ncbi:hypothetical protein KKE34_01990 [Patescibacteria group bacterium]|nr:hypothetical protein [Patescibacteria group bacterium]MBU1885356.1 hypothetical protein [Patescibacteria group bacterium]
MEFGLEVDFVLGEAEVVIEVKGSNQIDGTKLKGLKAFVEEFKPRKAIVISTESRVRVIGQEIEVLPWEEFLRQLWDGEVILIFRLKSMV